MLKYSETIINSSVRRQDATWDYRWQYNSDNPDNIFLTPDMQFGGNLLGTDTWHLCGDASELRQYDENTWDPNHPVLEYEVEKNVEDSIDGQGPTEWTEKWDSDYQYNPTRYLRPADSKFIRITNTTQNVTIDPIPPKFISDYGTEYLALESQLDGRKEKIDDKLIIYSKAVRTIAIEFQDEVGLDYRQVALVTGEVTDITNLKNNPNLIYYYDRSQVEEDGKPVTQKPYLEKIEFCGTSKGNYKVVFSLNEMWGQIKKNPQTNETYITDVHYITEEGILNDKGSYKKTPVHYNGEVIELEKYTKSNFTLVVWDLAGNYSIYHFTRPFNTLALDDLNKLVPVNILFTHIEPNNYFLEDGVEGKIITNVQDPNYVLWEYENVAKLLETSIGVIDKGSYEAGDNRTHNPLDGSREFIITHLTESGNVEVEAWVETGYTEIDELIKERTYNTAICGPWVYGDEGRKYHITPYIPKYLHGTEFADFMEFFQLYINTMYKGLDSNRNISGLEKIARIGNFNDIARLEDALVYHYAKEFGNEFDFDVQSLQEVNLIQDGSGYTTRDVKETFEIVKYVLEQLPAYNQYKGTNTGIEMAIKMFGFSCRVINLWVRKEQEIEQGPEFIEEDRLFSFVEHFMTSRFNLEMDARNNTFETFCDNIDMFIDLIKSIKPITKILNLIKYTIIKDVNVNLVYDLDVIEDEKSKETEYEFKWVFNKNTTKDVKNIEKLCKLDAKTGTADLFCLNYRPECLTNNAPPMAYNILAKFLKSNFDEIVLTVESKTESKTSYNLSHTGITPILNSGSFFLYLTDATTGTHGYNMIKKYFNFNKLYDTSEDNDYYVSVTMKFKIQPGTDYAVSYSGS